MRQSESSIRYFACHIEIQYIMTDWLVHVLRDRMDLDINDLQETQGATFIQGPELRFCQLTSKVAFQGILLF